MRTFSEPEVAEIIARAVERQRAAERGPSAPDGRTGDGGAAGLTLAEIEHVGRASGIDPVHLRAAAEDVAAGPPLGAAAGDVAVVERWADAPFTDAGWEDVVAHLRASPGPLGASTGGDEEAVERIGGSFEWTRTSAMLGVTTRVNVSPRGDRTRVRVTQPDVLSTSDTAFAYAAVSALVGGLAGFFLGADGWALAAVVLATGLVVYLASLLGVRESVREHHQKELARLGDLADALVPLLEAAADVPPTPEARAAEGSPPVTDLLGADPLGAPDAGEDVEPVRPPDRRQRARS